MHVCYIMLLVYLDYTFWTLSTSSALKLKYSITQTTLTNLKKLLLSSIMRFFILAASCFMLNWMLLVFKIRFNWSQFSNLFGLTLPLWITVIHAVLDFLVLFGVPSSVSSKEDDANKNTNNSRSGNQIDS